MVHVAPFGDEEDELSEEEIDAGLAAGDLVFVEPLPSSEEYEWMVEFAASVTEPRPRELLQVPIDGRGAFRRFKNALLDYPEERARWFAFRDGGAGEGLRPVSHSSVRGRRPVRGLLPIGFAAVNDAKDEDGMGYIVYFEENPVIAGPHPPAIDGATQLGDTWGSRVSFKREEGLCDA